MAYTHVSTPIKLGTVEVENRILRPAHALGFGEGMMSDGLIAYHELRARGGVGLIINGIGSVHPSTTGFMDIFKPTIEGGMRKLVERIKPHGAKIFQQLWHGGNYAGFDGSVPWSVALAFAVRERQERPPSPLPCMLPRKGWQNAKTTRSRRRFAESSADHGRAP